MAGTTIELLHLLHLSICATCAWPDPTCHLLTHKLAVSLLLTGWLTLTGSSLPLRYLMRSSFSGSLNGMRGLGPASTLSSLAGSIDLAVGLASRAMSSTIKMTIEQVQPHAQSLISILKKYIYIISFTTSLLLVAINLPIIYGLAQIPWNVRNEGEQPVFNYNPAPLQIMVAVQAGLPMAIYPCKWVM